MAAQPCSYCQSSILNGLSEPTTEIVILNMRNSVKRWLLHYYIALQLGAGAATQLSIVSLDEGPPPIVRPYRDQYSGPWDPREVITTGRKSAIVTTYRQFNAESIGVTRWLN